MKTLPPLPEGKVWLDFTTLSHFIRCPRAYWWNRVRRVRQIPGPQLANGSAYHKAIEVYELAKLDGKSETDAEEKGVCAGREIMETIPPDNRTGHFLPDVFESTFRYYIKYYQDEPYRTISVEDGMSVDLGEFVYVCLVDRWAESPLGLVAIEHKTTSIPSQMRWAEKASPNLQVDGYVNTRYLMSGGKEMPCGAVLDIIPMHSDDKKREQPFRLQCPRSIQQVEAWIKDIQGWFKQIKLCEETQNYPRSTENCTSLVGWQRDHRIIKWKCEYRVLCNLYPDPINMDDIKIPDDFEENTWSPFDGL